jgi:hypothetical protein
VPEVVLRARLRSSQGRDPHEGSFADLTRLVQELDALPVLAGGHFVLPDELLEVVLAEVMEELDPSFDGRRFPSRLLLFATSLVNEGYATAVASISIRVSASRL